MIKNYIDARTLISKTLYPGQTTSLAHFDPLLEPKHLFIILDLLKNKYNVIISSMDKDYTVIITKKTFLQGKNLENQSKDYSAWDNENFIVAFTYALANLIEKGNFSI